MDGACQKGGGEGFTDSSTGRNETGMGLLEGGDRADRFFHGRFENWEKRLAKD
jgi:hypothetical protein